MRTYFNTLLGSSQQQKQLPFIIPLLISLCAGAIFSLALAPYYYWWLAILSPALLYASLKNRTAKQAFGIGCIWFWLMVCRSILALYLDPCLRRYQCCFKCTHDWLYT